MSYTVKRGSTGIIIRNEAGKYIGCGGYEKAAGLYYFTVEGCTREGADMEKAAFRAIMEVYGDVGTITIECEPARTAVILVAGTTSKGVRRSVLLINESRQYGCVPVSLMQYYFVTPKIPEGVVFAGQYEVTAKNLRELIAEHKKNGTYTEGE